MDVKELGKVWSGFMASRILLTANHFRVFDRLESPMGTEGMASAIKADRRAVRTLLDALTGLGLLRKSGGKYRNTPVASRHLVSGKPEYQGDIISHSETLWENWSALNEVMLTGLPARRAHDHRSFINGMHNIALLRVRETIKAIDLRGARTALDLGGGPGTYAIALAKRGLDVTLFDMPETMRIARLNAKQAGVKLRFRKGDFMADDIGKGFDLVLISQIFHAYSEEYNVMLLEKCRAALNPGGRVAVQEALISDDMTRPLRGALFAVNMLVNTVGGRCYSPGEMKRWLKKTGFKHLGETVLGETVLIQGVRD